MDKLKLSFIKEATEVNVYEKHGVVVVKLHGYLSDYSYYDEEIIGVGVARLKDDDTFNRELGIKIATAKAESNAYRKAVKLVKPLVEYWKKQLFTNLDFVGRAEGVMKHNEQYIHDIGGKVTD